MIDFKNEGKESLQQIIQAARVRLGTIEHREAVAAMKPLVGKCFKYRNNYSLPKKPSDYWWLYLKIIAAKDGSAITFEFQTDQYGKVNIEPRQTHYNRAPGPERGYQPISVGEFDRAWKAVQKRVAGWKP